MIPLRREGKEVTLHQGWYIFSHFYFYFIKIYEINIWSDRYIDESDSTAFHILRERREEKCRQRHAVVVAVCSGQSQVGKAGGGGVQKNGWKKKNIENEPKPKPPNQNHQRPYHHHQKSNWSNNSPCPNPLNQQRKRTNKRKRTNAKRKTKTNEVTKRNENQNGKTREWERIDHHSQRCQKPRIREEFFAATSTTSYKQ